MPLDAGTGFIKILPQLGPNFTGALQSQVQPALSRIGSRTSQIGTAMTKFVTLPIIGIGAAAIASAVKVDDALDLIRARTGAVGEELQALEADFEAIGRTTPADLQSIAEVVSDLNQRLDITGPRLRTLAKQILEGGRILDQGAVSVDAITRLFGDWGVATQDQTKLLDTLFRASQQGGGTINSLAEGVVQFGAPLRSLGYTLEESIALWARFQAEGVNTTTVMAGMRMFLSNAAEEGQNAEDAFRRVTDEILRLTEAGEDARAQDLAREWFGARTFQDVVRAIQEGRFETEEWVRAITQGGDSILEVSKETRDFGEQWTVFKNKAMLALAPLGERLFPALSSAIETVAGAVTSLVEGFTKLPQGVQKGIIFALLGAAAAGPFLSVAGGIMRIAGSLHALAGGAKAAAGAPALGGSRGLLGGFLASGPGGLAVATTLTAIVAGIKNAGDAAQEKTAFINAMSQALLSGQVNTRQLHGELMKMRTTIGPIGGVYDAVALMDNIVAQANQSLLGQSRNLRRLGIELTATELAAYQNYVVQGDLYGQLLVLTGALQRGLGPLKNAASGARELKTETADAEQHVRGLAAAFGDFPTGPVDGPKINTPGLDDNLAKLGRLRGIYAELDGKVVNTTVVTTYKRVGTPSGAGGHQANAQEGFSGTVRAPTLFLTGEGGEAEDVLIVPHSKGGIAQARVAGSQPSGGGGVTLVIEGDVVIADGSDAEDFSELVAAGVAQGFEQLHWSAHGAGG